MITFIVKHKLTNKVFEITTDPFDSEAEEQNFITEVIEWKWGRPVPIPSELEITKHQR